MSVFCKTYSNKSNARRAAVKAGLTTFAVVEAEFDGKMVWQVVGEDDLLPTDEVLHANEAQQSDAEFMAPVLALDEMGMHGDGNKCPHCGINHIDNGYRTFADVMHTIADNTGKRGTKRLAQAAFDAGMVNEYECMACNGQWGKQIDLAAYESAPATPAPKGKGVSIQKHRETRNGITRPSAGGKCAAVWQQCDAMVAEGVKPMPALMKAWATEQGHNPSNAVIEMYQWRKFVA